MSALPTSQPIKITLSGKTGVLLDEATYDGLLETILILQENPNIVQDLSERERGEFVDEEDIMNYAPSA